MNHLIRTLALSFVAFILITSTSTSWAESTKYTCPMHPNYISEDSGTCPICGMTLVEIDNGDKDESSDDMAGMDMSSNETTGEKKILYWQAPMNPNFKSDKPGKSPMGMDLVPVYAEASVGKSTSSSKSAIIINAETIQNIGVRTEKAQMTRFGTEVRSYGVVADNIRLKQAISSRIAGWVEKLAITAVGDEVKKGDLLFEMYSPELISTQQDYLAALKTGSKGRIASSAKRLKSLGVQDKFINKLKKTRKKSQNVPFYAENAGIVSMLHVSNGSYVKPGMPIANIQNYSSVWIDVSIAEKDMQFLVNNGKATVVLPNLGDIERTARIDYIYPTLDAKTRTGQVRLVLDNKNGELKPGAYADVTFETNIDKRLAVPSEAILKSSDGDYIVVALGNGRFQPQKVTTGIQTKGRTEIKSGINDGDNVVVSSQFLIDSESSLRESFRKLQLAQKPLNELNVDDEQLKMIDHLVDVAIYLHETLTTNKEFDANYIMPSLKVNDHLIPKFRGTKLQFILENAEKAILEAKDSVTDKELQLALTRLMVALTPWITEGNPNHYIEKGLKMFTDHETSGTWVQLGEKPKNPYSTGMSMAKPLTGEK